MTIPVSNTVQRFYPAFFLESLRDGSRLYNSDFKVALFSNKPFNENNNSLSVYQNPIIDVPISGSEKDITVTMSRSLSKINFQFPVISWSGLDSNLQFRYIISWKEFESDGVILKLLFSHFDLGESYQAQDGNFLFTPNSTCIPNINLQQRVCS